MKRIVFLFSLLSLASFSVSAKEGKDGLGLGISFIDQVPVGDYANFVRDTIGGGLTVEAALPLPLSFMELGVSGRIDYLHSLPKKGLTLSADDEMRFYAGAWLRVPFEIHGVQFAVQPELGYGLSVYKTDGQKGAKASGCYAGNLISFAPSLRWIPLESRRLEVELSPLFTWVYERPPYVVAETGARLGILFRPFSDKKNTKSREEPAPNTVYPAIFEVASEIAQEPLPPVIPEIGIFVRSGEGFTPDGDEDNDDVEFSIACKDFSAVPESWILAIYDSHGNSVRTFSGEGMPPKTVIWDGKSEDGIPAASRNRYTAFLSVVPEKGLRERCGLNAVVDSCEVRSGIILEVLVPHQKWRIVVNSLTFPAGVASSEGMNEEEKEFTSNTLDEVAKQIKDHRNTMISIDGYANNMTQTDREELSECLPLSEARARFVMQELVSRGIESSVLVPVGKGSANPVVSLSDKDNRWKNRRIEFVITKKNLMKNLMTEQN